MATSYKRRRQYMRAIRNREAFKSSTGNLWARWETLTKRETEGNHDSRIYCVYSYSRIYCVYSYETPIAEYNGINWAVDTTKYSATTTHHQSIVALAIDPNYPLGD